MSEARLLRITDGVAHFGDGEEVAIPEWVTVRERPPTDWLPAGGYTLTMEYAYPDLGGGVYYGRRGDTAEAGATRQRFGQLMQYLRRRQWKNAEWLRGLEADTPEVIG